jgi:hypothetical protein
MLVALEVQRRSLGCCPSFSYPAMAKFLINGLGDCVSYGFDCVTASAGLISILVMYLVIS